MSGGWPRWSQMTWLRLLEGPHNLVVLPIAPTMARLTYKGVHYFRMPDTRSTLQGRRRRKYETEHGGAYLWSGWWQEQLDAARAAQIVRESS